MNNMRRGFTMIELIFVIVIIGILAAVAVPRLSATRDDAKLSTEVANAKTCLGEAKAYYTANGNLTNLTTDACTAAATTTNTVTATIVKTVGSESVTIAGAPANTIPNGTFTDFKGTSVNYNS